MHLNRAEGKRLTVDATRGGLVPPGDAEAGPGVGQWRALRR